MLSIEHEIKMNGFTLFRDHADKRKYYYLPKGNVRIAGNGKKLNYYAYVDSEMRDNSEPEFTDDINQSGGFLTLEVELGPTEEELQALKDNFATLLPYAQKQALAEKKERGESIRKGDPEKEEDVLDEEDTIASAGEFVLAPVMFKEGDVKLLVLGEDGSSENPLSQVKIVGSQHPSLFGQQNAVFSVRLGGKEAELMYNMLTCGKKKQTEEDQKDDEANSQNTTEEKEKYINSQIAVIYDLTYKGIEPAHYVKITVDFKAVEDFWNHHFELDGDFNYGKKNESEKKGASNKDNYNISIVADVDLDILYRELINKGYIVVQQIDFSGNNAGSPLPADDPSAIELVKKLLTAELFTPTPLPKEDYSAYKEAAETIGGVVGNIVGQKPEEKKPEGQKPEEKKPEEQKPAGQKTGTQSTAEQIATGLEAAGQVAEGAATIARAVGGQTSQNTSGTSQSGQNTTTTVTLPPFSSIAGEDGRISKDEWLKKGFSEEDYEKYAIKREFVYQENYKKYYDAMRKKNKKFSTTFSMAAGEDDAISFDEWLKIGGLREEWPTYATKEIFIDEEQYKKFKEEKEKAQSPGNGGQQNPNPGQQQPSTGTPGQSALGTVADAVASTVSAIEWKLDVRLAYSYKKRNLKETLKRTYIFNKQMAVNQIIHPSGMLTVEGTAFDVDKQVVLGRLGEEIFRKHTVQFRSALDFDAYHLKYIGIDVSHPDSTGKVLELTKESPSAEITFFSENFGKEGSPGGELSYKVSMVFDSQSQVGFDNNESICIEKSYTTSEKVIVIGEDHIAGILPLSIMTGNLTFDKNIKSATFSLLQDEGGDTLGPSLYVQKLASSTSNIVLLNSEKQYRARVQYNLESPYDDVPVTKKELTVTSEPLKAKEVVVEDPTAGMIKISTVDGDDSFETIRSIEVQLEQNGRVVPFTLSKKTPEYYFVTNYNAGAPEKITVKSVLVNYRDRPAENFIPNVREFYTDATEYVLDL